MARPRETGLKYFPLDVDFFNDEKVEAIAGEFGIKGEIAILKLLCAVYRNGYFILWTEMLKMKLLKNLPGVSPELLDQIVNRLVKWDFFDKGLFDSDKILTSRGIQRRYFEAVKRRKSGEEYPYLLVSVCINPDADELMYAETPQSKEKKSKEIKERRKMDEMGNGVVPVGTDGSREEVRRAKDKFEEVRRAFQGRKRGAETEWENFRKRCRGKELETVLEMMEGLRREIGWRARARERGEFVPEWPNLSTWVNQRRWETEWPGEENLETERRVVFE